MTPKEKRELDEFRALGISPQQIRAIIKDAAKMREYIEFLETL